MSTNTSDTEKTITDPAEIRAAFAAWAADEDSWPTRLSLVLAPLHDRVWWDSYSAGDTDGDGLPRSFIVAAGTGGEVAVNITDAEIGRVCFREPTGSTVALGPQHVRAIKTNSPLVHREVDGLEYTLTLLPGEGATVGCQHITRAGCRQVVDILAAHLGLEVRPAARWKVGDLVKVTGRGSIPDHEWIEWMESRVGQVGTVEYVSRAECDSVPVRVKFADGDGWWWAPDSLEAV